MMLTLLNLETNKFTNFWIFTWHGQYLVVIITHEKHKTHHDESFKNGLNCIGDQISVVFGTNVPDKTGHQMIVQVPPHEQRVTPQRLLFVFVVFLHCYLAEYTIRPKSKK